MRNTNVTINMTYFAGIIFLLTQLGIFVLVMGKTDSPGAYLLGFVIGLVFFGIVLLTLRKYRLGGVGHNLEKIESAAIVIQLVSMIFLFLTTVGVPVFLGIAYYMGFVLLLLGGIGYYKYRHKINLAFLAWGIYVILWVHNLYIGTWHNLYISTWVEWHS